MLIVPDEEYPVYWVRRKKFLLGLIEIVTEVIAVALACGLTELMARVSTEVYS